MVVIPSLVCNFIRSWIVDMIAPYCSIIFCPSMILCSEGDRMTMNSSKVVFFIVLWLSYMVSGIWSILIVQKLWTAIPYNLLDVGLSPSFQLYGSC